MPTPRYQQRVEEARLPGARVENTSNEEAFGGGRSFDRLRQAVGGLGQEIADIARKAKNDADQLAVLNADSKLAELQVGLQIEGEKFRGGEAMKGMDHVQQGWGQGLDEIKKGLSNEEQRRAFERISANRWESLNKHQQLYAAKESQVFDRESTDSAIQSYRNIGLTNYQDDASIDEALGQQDAAFSAYMQRQGRSEADPEVRVGRMKLMGEMHAAVIDRMLSNGQDLDAKKYFERRREAGQIPAEFATKIEKGLRASSILGEANRQASSILETNGGSERKALEAARKIEDPEVMQHTVREVKLRFQERENEKRKFEENRFLRATQLLEKHKDLAKIPFYNDLPMNERNAIDNRLEQLRTGKKPTTDWNSFYKLKTIAADPDGRNEFARLNLLTYRDKMADSEFKELVDLQASVRNGDDKAKKVLDGFRSDNQIVNDALSAAGFDPKSDEETYAQFRRSVDQEVMSYQERSGRKATNKEIQEVVDNLMVKGTVKGSGFLGMFKTERHAFQAKKGEQMEFDPKSIPKSDRDQIVRALTNKKLPVNDQTIMRAYMKKLERMVPDAE